MILGCSNSSPLRLKLISTVICVPGRDCSIGGGSQQSSSAASNSLSVLIWAAALPAVAITSTPPAIREHDLGIGAPRGDCADFAAAQSLHCAPATRKSE